MEDYNRNTQSTKTLLVLANSISGLYSFRKEVMKAFRDSGYNVVISVPEYKLQADYFKGIGCEVVLTEFKRRGMNPFSDLKQMLSYKKLIKQLKPIAVLTYTIKPNIYGGMAARLTGTPQLANITGLGDAVENGGWVSILSVFLYRLGLSKARSIFFQNASNRAFCIKKRIAKENSILLPGSGVNLMHHTYQPYPKDEGKVRFLFIGRLLKDKGIEELFETAIAIKTRYPEIEFKILGEVEGPYNNRLFQLVNEGIIDYVGTTSDVRPYIGSVECTIMPSYHEGMSNVNLESAANGRPVITTDVPGCRETVDNGITGILVKPRNTQDLINGVEQFMAMSYEQKKQMGINARKKVENEYDRQIVVNAYLKEIEGIDNV